MKHNGPNDASDGTDGLRGLPFGCSKRGNSSVLSRYSLVLLMLIVS